MHDTCTHAQSSAPWAGMHCQEATTTKRSNTPWGGGLEHMGHERIIPLALALVRLPLFFFALLAREGESYYLRALWPVAIGEESQGFQASGRTIAHEF
jgi:hypothetical protein